MSRYSESELDKILPKKKEILPLSTDYRFGKSTQHALWSYNQAIDDCRNALLQDGEKKCRCLTCNGTGDNLSDPFGEGKCVTCNGTGLKEGGE